MFLESDIGPFFRENGDGYVNDLMFLWNRFDCLFRWCRVDLWNDVFNLSNTESDFVSNIEECTSVEANVQKDSTVLTQSEHVVCPSDTFPPVEKERSDENWSGENI